MSAREDVEVSLIVAGMHLLEKHGNTVNEIVEDGFDIARKVYTIVEGETLETMTKSVGLTITEMSTVLQGIKPDIVVVHGDRFEVFGAAVAAAMMNIPVAHIQGGEVTGSIDESLRHAITKMAHIHLVSNQLAAERIIKLGEDPDYVFVIGCPMVDVLNDTPPLSIEELFTSPRILGAKDPINFDPSRPYLLVANHPVCSEFGENYNHTRSLLRAVLRTGMQALWMWPNADAGAREVVNAIKSEDNFFQDNDRIAFYRNLPIELFVNVMRNASCMIGNSSAGIREACYFGTPVVNTGSRQDGRLRPGNVVDVLYDEEDIYHAITTQIVHGSYPVEMPYGVGGTGEKMADLLATVSIPSVQKKLFY